MVSPYDSWRNIESTDIRGRYKGDAQIADDLAAVLGAGDLEALENILKAQTRYTGGILETDRFVFGWVDHIRSFPVFYAEGGRDGFVISPEAEEVRQKAALNTQDQNSLIEFAMAGYATGPYTLYEGLHALQPGEYVIWDKLNKTRSNVRYYRYFPQPGSADWENNERRLAAIMDDLTRGMIERAGGRKIWVPLSAGLDSRIILCKLHEHGYKNIETFTYGPRYNFELLHAKRIADKLGVPWRHIAPSRKQIRAYFENDKRKDYWAYAGQHKTIASMREYGALAYMRDNNIAQPGDIFINGQSGDYITGGHIFSAYFEEGDTDEDGFFSNIIDKHYSLWRCFLSDTFRAVIKERIQEVVGDMSGTSNPERAAQEEAWEYDARQICLVANGQRSYEFFGYDWEMPLWDKALCDFCETLSLEEKRGQALYKRYLRNYNYKELFPETEPKIWRWPLYMLWVLPVGQLIKLIKGREAKDNFYALMRYYGHYANQYALLSWEDHKTTYKNARNVMAVYVQKFLTENRFGFPPPTSERHKNVG
ncbi:MAG: asparagine synthase C-terminal domain-containing protein [Alphaproteobacteria bacterium]